MHLERRTPIYSEVQKKTIRSVESLVKREFGTEGTGHDWLHSNSVRNLAVRIAREEPGEKNIYVIELGALLHDLDDWKFKNETKGKPNVREILSGLHVPEEIVNQVGFITENISYKGGTNAVTMDTIEGQIVQDADRLEAMGAIGIARTFAYGGSIRRVIYDPMIAPIHADTAEAYTSTKSTTINHFYEKLLLLKDLLHTDSAKKIAQGRHEFMLQFLERFYAEYTGES